MICPSIVIPVWTLIAGGRGGGNGCCDIAGVASNAHASTPPMSLTALPFMFFSQVMRHGHAHSSEEKVVM
jgi:hypothetical protein